MVDNVEITEQLNEALDCFISKIDIKLKGCGEIMSRQTAYLNEKKE